ncbi:MAG: ParB/RepB/Spo0J family partition protein [Acidobacteriota bacterium]
MKKMKFTQVKLDQIDTSDRRFQIAPCFSVDSLISSIKRAGLLNPPVLAQRREKYVIVSGWRRITSCQKLSIHLIPVFVMQEKNDVEAFKIPVYESLSLRDFSHIEKAAVIRKFYDFGEKPENIIKKYMPLLKIPPKRETMDVYLKIDRLGKKIKETAHHKKWSLGTLEIMTELNDKETQSLYPFVELLSFNKQKQLIENIFDISRKQEVSVQTILNSGEFLPIKESQNLNPVQRAERIYRLSKKLKNPTLNSWREAFEKLCQSLNLPEEVKVIPSKYFEDETITIKLDIRNREELKNHIQKLKELSDKKEISLLFDPFSHD